MKKYTKAAIKAAPRFVLAIDYTANYKPLTIDFFDISADTIPAAINEAAGKMHDIGPKNIWCMNLYESTSRLYNDRQQLIYAPVLDCFDTGDDDGWNAGEHWTAPTLWEGSCVIIRDVDGDMAFEGARHVYSER